MAAVGVVLVGVGRAGNVRIRDLKEATKWDQTKRVKLIGYVSRRQLDIEGVPQLTLEEALERNDVHVVIIATENKTHFDLAKKSIEAGKHVLVEFPLATNADEVRKLQVLAKEKGVLCHEEVISLLLDSHHQTKDIVKSKPLKECSINFQGSYNGWIEDIEGSGTPFTTGISHLHGMYDFFGDLKAIKASLLKDDKGCVCMGTFHTMDDKPITLTSKRTKEPLQRSSSTKFVFEDGSESEGAPRVFPKDGPGLFMRDFIQFIEMLEKGSPVLPSPEATLHCHQLADDLAKMALQST